MSPAAGDDEAGVRMQKSELEQEPGGTYVDVEIRCISVDLMGVCVNHQTAAFPGSRPPGKHWGLADGAGGW